MSRTLKILLAIVGALVLFVAAIAVFVPAPDEPAATPEAPTVAATAAPAASISLVAGQSFCLALPNAKIGFYITLRNDDAVAGDIDATPWRRYSDNEVNDSIVDTLTMTVPPGVKKFRAEFGYNAEAHSLLECGLIMEGDTEPTPIAVE